MNFVEPIRDRRDVLKIKKFLREYGEQNLKSYPDKYYIMFITGIYLGLRINEILKMTVGDVKGRKTCTFRQSKTGKEIMVEYNAELLRAYKEYCEHRTPDEALIPSPYNEYKPITRDMAYKVMNKAKKAAGIQYSIGTHTLRKTCGYHYYRQTKDIATLQIWFNHTSPEETLRYIGVTRDSVLKAMRNFRI